jgi:hypothetical protein
MKKSMVLAALLFLSLGVFAFEAIDLPEATPLQEKTTKQKDCVLMKDGNMYVIKGGETTEMTKAVTMSNGTKVLANGEVITKNGETSKLGNGDVVYMNGKIEKKTPGN